MHHWHISPVVPGRHTYLLRQFIDAEDGTALVTACYDKLITNSLNDVFFIFSFQVLQFSFLYPLVYLTIYTNSAYHYALGRTIQHTAGHLLEITLQAGNSPMNTRMLPYVIRNTGILQ